MVVVCLLGPSENEAHFDCSTPNWRSGQRTTSILRGTWGISMTFTSLTLRGSLSLAISFVTGCASPQVAYIIPGSPAPTHARELSTSTMAATPASVQTPPASYIGGIGVGYDSYVSLPVTLTSVYGFSGQVSLSVAGRPEGVVTSSALFSRLIPRSRRAPITPAPAILPATLTVTSGGSGAWQKGNWFIGDRQGAGKSAVQSFAFPSTGPYKGCPTMKSQLLQKKSYCLKTSREGLDMLGRREPAPSPRSRPPTPSP
jgi:hypothetical protein